MTNLFLFLGLLSWSGLLLSADSLNIEPHFGEHGKQRNLRGLYIRTQIKEAHSSEFRVIGELSNLCTATLIGPKHLLTAAHCVYNQQLNIWQDNLDFTPAKVNAQSIPFGRYEWASAYAPQEFINGSLDAAFDYAVIELEENIGQELGWAGVRAINEKEDIKTIRLSGYPGDKKRSTLWTVNCPSTIEDNKIIYKCDTFAGMSGSGVFSFDEESEEAGFIVGVHSYGGVDNNGGASINKERLRNIKQWMQDKVPELTLKNKNTEIFSSFKLYAINNCRDTIDSYFSYFNAYTGMWANDGVISLIPGLKTLVGRTLNSFYYIWGESYKKIWSGESIILYNSENLPMVEKRIELKDWGSWKSEFNCD